MSRLVLLSYANAPFRDAQRRLCESARAVGGFDDIRPAGPADLDRAFSRRHRSVLRHFRGGGYWIWKPHLILQELVGLRDGDFLLYCDSGARLATPVSPLVEAAVKTGQWLTPFLVSLRHIERHWTKRDAFLLLGCDSPRYAETAQRMGGFSLWRRCEESISFCREWLRWAGHPLALTDLGNRLGKPNYEGFVEHRHDQSLFSLLTKRHGLAASPPECGPFSMFRDRRDNKARRMACRLWETAHQHLADYDYLRWRPSR